jgi:F-type H+-transporting ATPase subunit a
MIQEYKPFELTPTLLSIIVVFLIIIALFSTYAIKVRKLKDNIAPKGFVLIMQMYFTMIDNLVKQIIGRSSKNITPYIIFLMTYLIVANTIGIFGLENPTGSITLNISLAFITFLGTFAVGVKYHKLSYFKKFFFNAKIKGKKIPLMINPLSILSAFTPIISLSFRLWGNLLAGSIIITM